ncbi:dermonecrotic toxin domain-containing protein [Burkholderia sp. AW49-1]
MVVRHITGQAALPQNQIAEQEVKDPSDASKQHRNDAHIGHLQPLAQLKQESAPASQWSSATHAATRFASTRSKRDAAGATGPQIEQAGVRAERSVPSTAAAPSGTSDTDADNKANTLRDAQQAFEKQFPNVPKPVDLNKIYVNTYEEKGNPPTRVLKSSDSLANYILKRSNAGEKVNFGEVVTGGMSYGTSGANGGFADVSEGRTRTAYGIFNSPNAVDSKDEVRGTTPKEVEVFINGLPTSGVQRKKIAELESLSERANTVFEQKPRPSPLEDAQHAFEAKFPKVPKPVDLNKIYVNAYREQETPPRSGKFTREWVSSRSMADYVKERYTGGGEIDLGGHIEDGTSYGVFSSPDAGNDEDMVSGMTASTVEQYIKGLSPTKAKDVRDQNANYFKTPDRDGKTPVQKLGEIRQKQIQAEAELQYADGTLSEKGRKLVESVAKNPTQAELEHAFPNEDGRPRVYTLKFNSSNNTEESDPDEPLHGPIVMMTAHADNYPDEKDVVVVYLPGQGILEFDSLQAMKDHFAKSEERPKLLGFVSEWTQAKWPENVTYGLGTNEVPPQKNLFEYSVEEQIKKQRGDTEYRLTQARERGADLTEYDGIAGSSSDDLRESFDADGVLTERDLRLIEKNRPVWWQTSSEEDKAKLKIAQNKADERESKLAELQGRIPSLQKYTADEIRQALQAEYPGIDPDKVMVTVTYPRPSGQLTGWRDTQGPTRTEQVSLTEYVMYGRSFGKSDFKTTVAGGLSDFFNKPAQVLSEFFSAKSTSADAKITLENGQEIVLDKSKLDALAKKVNVGTNYEKLLNDEYLGVNGKFKGQPLYGAWRPAYLARMEADLQEAEMRGLNRDFDHASAPQYKRPSKMVQAVLEAPDPEAPDPRGRKKVNGYTIQTEAFTVDIGTEDNKFGTRTSHASVPVNGVIVIAAGDGRGNPLPTTVVLYTPDAPDGIAYRTFDNREKMKDDPMFKRPEWIEYIKGRMLSGQVTYSGFHNPITHEQAVEQYGGKRVRGSSLTLSVELGTKPIKGDFTDEVYQNNVALLRDNVKNFTVTNEEIARQRADEIVFGAGAFFAFATAEFSGRSLNNGAKRFFRAANPRRLLSEFPKGTRFTEKIGAPNKAPVGVVTPNTFSPFAASLKDYAVHKSYLKGAKYQSNGTYLGMDGREYVRIDNAFFRTSVIGSDDHAPQRRVIHHRNGGGNPIEIQRIGNRWIVRANATGPGGAGGATNPQDKWTADYWKKDLPPSELNAALTRKNDFWKKYAQDAKKAGFKEKGEPRTLGQVVDSGKELLDDLEKKGKDLHRFEAYRAMGKEEAKGIMEWLKQKDEVEEFIKNGAKRPGGNGKLTGKELSEYLKSGNRIIPVKNHLGDFGQAKRYTQADVIVKFTFKPGADELLFDPKYMAVSRGGGDATISLVMQAQRNGKYYPAASGNEGALGGYIGVKSEANGPFSLSLGNGSQPSQLLFGQFVEKIEFLNKNTGMPLTPAEQQALFS